MTAEEINIISPLKWVIIRSIRLQRNIDPRDVMQDLYLKILGNYETFEKLSYERKKGYAYISAINLLYDMHRSRNRQNRKGKNIGLFMNEEGDMFSALQEKERAYDLIELHETLKKLSKYPLAKELMMLAEGYHVREISEINKIKVNTVLGRCRYSRKFLRA